MTEPVSARLSEFSVDKGHEVRFLDPVLGVELQRDVPPPCFAHDPLLSRGIAQLEKMSADRRISIDLVQSPHGGAEDFKDVLRDFQPILSAADVVGTETQWRTNKPTNDEPPAWHAVEPVLVGTNVSYWREFQQEQLSWLKENDKPMLPCCSPKNYETKFFERYEQLLTLSWDASRQKDPRTTTILWGTFQVLRQWTFIAQLGYWISRIEEAGELPNRNIKVVFTSGSLHTQLEPKLINYFKIPTQRHTVVDRTLGPILERDEDEDELFINMTAHARVTVEELKHAYLLE